MLLPPANPLWRTPGVGSVLAMRENDHGFANHVQRVQLDRLRLDPERHHDGRTGADDGARDAENRAQSRRERPLRRWPASSARCESALDTLTDADGFSPYTVASGDPDAVGVTTTSGSVAGLYEVVVSELAHAQVMASTTTYASPDEVIATGGSLSVALFGNPPVQIPPAALAGSMTVQAAGRRDQRADRTRRSPPRSCRPRPDSTVSC